jgi:hypothetical protein
VAPEVLELQPGPPTLRPPVIVVVVGLAIVAPAWRTRLTVSVRNDLRQDGLQGAVEPFSFRLLHAPLMPPG